MAAVSGLGRLGRSSATVVALVSLASLFLFPLAYVLWCLARGAVVHEYPYPFIDVDQIGMAVVLRNAAGIFVLLVALVAFLVGGDRALGRRRHAVAPS